MTFLISFIPFLFMAFYFILLLSKKKENIRFDISWGERCWHCKDKIIIDTDDPNYSTQKQLRLCQSCVRDVKISQINSPLLAIKNRVNKFIVSDSFRKFTNILITLNLVFLAIQIVVTFTFKTSWSWLFMLITTTLNCSFWILLILQDRFTTIKKPSDV